MLEQSNNAAKKILEGLNEGIQNYLRTQTDKLTKGSRPIVLLTYNKNCCFPISFAKLTNSSVIFETNNTTGYYK